MVPATGVAKYVLHRRNPTMLKRIWKCGPRIGPFDGAVPCVYPQASRKRACLSSCGGDFQYHRRSQYGGSCVSHALLRVTLRDAAAYRSAD